MQPLKILLISSHPLSTEQREALHKRFGTDCIIVSNDSIIGDAKAIIRQFEEDGYHDLVVNSSIEALEELLKKGVHPIIAKMQRGKGTQKDKFLGYKRLIAIERTREKVKADPQPNKRKILWWSNQTPLGAEIKALEVLFGNIEVIHKLLTRSSIEEIAEYISQEGIFKLIVKTKSRWLLLRLREAGITYISPYIDTNASPERAEWKFGRAYCRLKGFYYTYRNLIEEEL